LFGGVFRPGTVARTRGAFFSSVFGPFSRVIWFSIDKNLALLDCASFVYLLEGVLRPCPPLWIKWLSQGGGLSLPKASSLLGMYSRPGFDLCLRVIHPRVDPFLRMPFPGCFVSGVFPSGVDDLAHIVNFLDSPTATCTPSCFGQGGTCLFSLPSLSVGLCL